MDDRNENEESGHGEIPQQSVGLEGAAEVKNTWNVYTQSNLHGTAFLTLFQDGLWEI